MVKTSLPTWGLWVRSLVEELRSHMLYGQRKKNINASNIVANPIKTLKWFTSKKSLKEYETMFNGSFITALLIIINIGIIPNVY